MKDKYQAFLKNRKEILVFAGLCALILSSIILITLNLGGPDAGVDGPPDDTPSTSNPISTDKLDSEIKLPLKGDFVITRYFYGTSEDEKEQSVIISDNEMIKSMGISYSTEENVNFACLAIYEGVVESVEEYPGYGMEIVIKHDNGLVSHYRSLSEVNVKVGDSVKTNGIIGTSGTSVIDVDAKNHIHLKTVLNGNTIDPRKVIGQKINDLNTEEK